MDFAYDNTNYTINMLNRKNYSNKSLVFRRFSNRAANDGFCIIIMIQLITLLKC